MNPTRKLLLAGVAFAFLAGLSLWLFWGNRGFVVVKADPPAYVVTVSGFGKLPCAAGACRLAVPFGKRELCLKADGYESVCETLTIPWRREIIWQPDSIRLPHFAEVALEGAPSPEPSPSGSPAVFYRFDPEKRLVRNDQGKTEVITVFHDLAAHSLTPWRDRLFVVSEGEAFLVDPIRKSKQRVYQGNKPVLHLLSDTVALIADGDTLWAMMANGNRFQKLPIIAPFRWVAACDESRLTIAHKKEPGQGLSFSVHDLATGKTRVVAQAVIKNEAGLALSCVPDDPRSVRLDLGEGEAKLLKF